MAAANAKFEEFNEKSEVEELKQKMQETTEQEEKYERKCNSVEKEITLLREQSSLQLKLESCNAELMEKEKEIETLRNKHEETLEMLLGKKDYPTGGMMDTINEIQIVLVSQSSVAPIYFFIRKLRLIFCPISGKLR